MYNIASQGGKYKESVKQEELEKLMKEAIGKKAPPTITKPEITPAIEAADIKKIESKREIQISEPGGFISDLMESEISLTSPSTSVSSTIEDIKKVEAPPK